MKFDGAYHGAHDYGMVGYNTTPASSYPKGNVGSAGIPHGVTDSVLAAPFNNLSFVEELFRRMGGRIAAVIVEPLQRTIPPAPGFLAGLRELTERHGALLIFDEVVTGFRLAYGGAQEIFGVEADLTACGKALGGGYPLAAFAGPDEIMSHLDRRKVDPSDCVFHSGTLNANPVCTAAGLATLDALNEADYDRLRENGQRLMDGMRNSLADVGVDAQVVGHETVFEVFFTSKPVVDFKTAVTDRTQLEAFSRSLKEDGIHKGSGKFYVGFCHSDDDIDRTLAAFQRAAQAVASGTDR